MVDYRLMEVSTLASCLIVGIVVKSWGEEFISFRGSFPSWINP